MLNSETRLDHNGGSHSSPHWFAQLGLPCCLTREESRIYQRFRRVCGSSHSQGKFVQHLCWVVCNLNCFFFGFFFRQLIRDKRKKPSRPNTSFLRLVVARVIPTFQVLKSLASHQMIFFRYLITRVKLCSSVPLTSRLNALDFLRVLVLTPLSW